MAFCFYHFFLIRSLSPSFSFSVGNTTQHNHTPRQSHGHTLGDLMTNAGTHGKSRAECTVSQRGCQSKSEAIKQNGAGCSYGDKEESNYRQQGEISKECFINRAEYRDPAAAAAAAAAAFCIPTYAGMELKIPSTGLDTK